MLGGSIAPEVGCETGEPPLTLDVVHIDRSRIVEKCVEAERHTLRLLQAAGARCSAKAPLSQKIEALRETLASKPPKVRSDKLLTLLERLEPLSNWRSQLVHSTVTVAPVEGEVVAVFRCASEQLDGSGERLIMTRARLRWLFDQLSQVANSLKQECATGAGLPLSRE